MRSRWIVALVVSVAAGLLPAGLTGTASAVQPVAQTSLVSDNPSDFTPNVLDGTVDKIVRLGDTMVISGLFTQVQEAGSSTTLSRQNIVAFSRTTGAINPNFNPTIDGEVQAMAASADGTKVYIGGLFNTVDGVAATGIAELNISDGSLVTQFKPPLLDALVEDVVLHGDTLFVTGAFTTARKSGVTYPRGGMVGLAPSNGAVLAAPAVQFSGTHNGGVTRVSRIDFTPDGTRLIAIGNFSAADGLDRNQVAMIDLTTSPMSVASWQTNQFKSICGGFQYYVRDVEFSPDGSYFIIGATGGPGAGPPTLCDTVTRWPTNTNASGIVQTWADWTGGDTTYSVAVTGSVVYVGGHQRYWNNPFGRDTPGQGAVSRQGIGALDPANGLPLSWDPQRERGLGVFDFLDTEDGLWVASDTDRIGHFEYHGRIAFFPLAKGKALPPNQVGSLPSDVYQLGRQGGDPASPVLYRVNAGGDAQASLDTGPDWAADSATTPSALHNTGATAATYTPIANVQSSVPSSTPRSIFNSDREDPSAAPEMQWHLPVAAGLPVQVRLYFANRCACTKQAGKRKFDVSIDGTAVLSNYDIVADVGDQTGVMKSFTRTSDGTVDINFTHRTNNPVISAIEIVRTDIPPPPPSNGDTVKARSFSGTTAGTVRSPSTGGVSWSSARGATMIDGTLYTGWTDGQLYARSYDGSSFGAPVSVDTADLITPMTTWHSEVPNITTMFYNGGRLYYTLQGQKALYYRYFTPESNVVGAQEWTASAANLADLDWSDLQGGFVTEDKFYYVTRHDGLMHRSDFSGGTVVSGTSVTLSGPGIDGVDWRAKALFLASFGSVDNKPTASFLSQCSSATCTFDGKGSSDDGSIASYTWNFGDGSTGSGPEPSHTYTKGGTYRVTLTVVDNAGQTDSKTADVFADIPNVVPVASFEGTCSVLTCGFDGTASSDPDGTIASYSWNFGDSTSGTGASPSHAYAAAGTYHVVLTVTDDSGATASTTRDVTATAPATAITFVGRSSYNNNATTATVSVPPGVSSGDSLVLFETDNGTGATVSGPSGPGWSLLQSASTGATSRVWRKTAAAGDAGSNVTLSFSTIVKAGVQLVAYRGASTASPVVTSAVDPAVTTTHTTPTAQVTVGGTWAVSYWADKSATTTAWTPPAGLQTRDTTIGSGSAHIAALVADSGQPVPGGAYGGLVARTDASSRALMFTVLLAPAS